MFTIFLLTNDAECGIMLSATKKNTTSTDLRVGKVNMINLKNETLDFLEKIGKTLDDVLFVSIDGKRTSINKFLAAADREYDNGYGVAEVNDSIKVVGNGWWLERFEYDGSEWWKLKQFPREPEEDAEELDIFNRT